MDPGSPMSLEDKIRLAVQQAKQATLNRSPMLSPSSGITSPLSNGGSTSIAGVIVSGSNASNSSAQWLRQPVAKNPTVMELDLGIDSDSEHGSMASPLPATSPLLPNGVDVGFASPSLSDSYDAFAVDSNDVDVTWSGSKADSDTLVAIVSPLSPAVDIALDTSALSLSAGTDDDLTPNSPFAHASEPVVVLPLPQTQCSTELPLDDEIASTPVSDTVVPLSPPAASIVQSFIPPAPLSVHPPAPTPQAAPVASKTDHAEEVAQLEKRHRESLNTIRSLRTQNEDIKRRLSEFAAVAEREAKATQAAAQAKKELSQLRASYNKVSTDFNTCLAKLRVAQDRIAELESMSSSKKPARRPSAVPPVVAAPEPAVVATPASPPSSAKSRTLRNREAHASAVPWTATLRKTPGSKSRSPRSASTPLSATRSPIALSVTQPLRPDARLATTQRNASRKAADKMPDPELTVMVDYVVEKTAHELGLKLRRHIPLKRNGPMLYTLNGSRVLQLGYIDNKVQVIEPDGTMVDLDIVLAASS